MHNNNLLILTILKWFKDNGLTLWATWMCMYIGAHWLNPNSDSPNNCARFQPLKWPVKSRTTQPYLLSALARPSKPAGYRIHWQDQGHKSSWFSSVKPHSKTRQWYVPRITCPKHKRQRFFYYYQARQHKNSWSLRPPPLWMLRSEITVLQWLYPTDRKSVV